MSITGDVATEVTATVSHLQQLGLAAEDNRGAAQVLSALLIAGKNPAAVARAAGLTLERRYAVVGLMMSAARHPHRPPERSFAPGAPSPAARVEAALATICGERAMPLIGIGGGTILIASDGTTEDDLPSNLIGHLSRAAGTEVTATVVYADVPDIPHATEVAHDLLDIAHRLEYGPGLYHFDDLAVEYQLTRQGTGRDILRARVQPLLQHPELIQTLHHYIESNAKRSAAADALRVHGNTVDYRLRRITTLTGFDPTRTLDLWQLQSALLVHTYDSADSRRGPHVRS